MTEMNVAAGKVSGAVYTDHNSKHTTDLFSEVIIQKFHNLKILIKERTTLLYVTIVLTKALL